MFADVEPVALAFCQLDIRRSMDQPDFTFGRTPRIDAFVEQSALRQLGGHHAYAIGPLEVRYSGEMPVSVSSYATSIVVTSSAPRSGSARASQPFGRLSWRPVLPSLSRPASPPGFADGFTAGFDCDDEPGRSILRSAAALGRNLACPV